MTPFDEADAAAVRLVAEKWADERHLELHRRSQKYAARLSLVALVLAVVVVLDMAMTLYDVWYRAGRWPWQ